MMALWPRESIAHDTGIQKSTSSPTEFTIAHNLRSVEEVDGVKQQANKAGAKIIMSVNKTFWGGYAGYFQDPDLHLCEIVWNPDHLPQE